MRSRQGRKRLSHCVFGCSIAFLHLHQTSTGENWGFAGLPGQCYQRGNVSHPPLRPVFSFSLSHHLIEENPELMSIPPRSLEQLRAGSCVCKAHRAHTDSVPKVMELKLALQKDFSGSEFYRSQAISTYAVNLEMGLPCVLENCF